MGLVGKGGLKDEGAVVCVSAEVWVGLRLFGNN